MTSVCFLTVRLNASRDVNVLHCRAFSSKVKSLLTMGMKDKIALVFFSRFFLDLPSFPTVIWRRATPYFNFGGFPKLAS